MRMRIANQWMQLASVAIALSLSGCVLEGSYEDEVAETEELLVPECPSFSDTDPDPLYVLPPDCPGDGGGGGPSPPPPAPPPATFYSSVGLGGTGPIRDLKFEKADYDWRGQPPLPGYILIPADLNKGAGGTYVYLTFTRDSSKVPYLDFCGVGNGTDFVTQLFAKDFAWYDAAGVKRTCQQIDGNGPSEPVLEPTGNPLWDWKHPDLNDGSGGRFIYAWQAKRSNEAPITEVGVISGSSGSIACPSGWTRINQDLNEGAGGDYIYFCVKR